MKNDERGCFVDEAYLFEKNGRIQETGDHEQKELIASAASYWAVQFVWEAPGDGLLMFGDFADPEIELPKTAPERGYLIPGPGRQCFHLTIEAPGEQPEIFLVRSVDGQSDALMPCEWVEVRKRERICLWLTAETPRGIGGMLKLKFNDQNGVFDEFSLPIRDSGFCFPHIRDFAGRPDFWQHNSTLARMYGIRPWSERHFALLAHYLRELARLGQKSATLVLSERPWNGQAKNYYLNGERIPGLTPDLLYEEQMTRVRRGVDGRLSVDFSIVERYLNLCFSLGIDREIELFGLAVSWNERMKVRCYDEKRGCFDELDAEDCADYLRQLYRYFEQKGLMDRVIVTVDEPKDASRLEAELEQLKRLAPGFRIKACFDDPELVEQFADKIHCLTSSLYTACMRCEEIRRLPVEKTWYVCCGPERPNTFVGSDPLEARALLYLNRVLGFDGFLRWAVWAWPRQPFARASTALFRPGDGFLLYPGADGLPLRSIRYYSMRRAFEDHELLYRLEQIAPEQCRLYLHQIWPEPDPGDYVLSPDKLRAGAFCLDYGTYERIRREIFSSLHAAAGRRGEESM